MKQQNNTQKSKNKPQKSSNMKFIIKIVFTTKNKCWKFKIDLDKCRLDEILMSLEEQYDLK